MQDEKDQAAPSATMPNEARLRNQAENIVFEVFGFPASAKIGRDSQRLQDLITGALRAAYASGVPAPSAVDSRATDEEENKDLV